jgi:hypothetical protein
MMGAYILRTDDSQEEALGAVIESEERGHISENLLIVWKGGINLPSSY